jgi:iron complex outermembrane receptor protein
VAAGAAYRFNKVWQASVRASYVEQGDDSFLVTEDDKSLDPEKQWRYEAGLIAGLHPAFQATTTVFYYDIKDMKQTVGSIMIDEDVVNIYDNADTVRRGLEMDISGYIFTPALNYGLSYSYQRSDNDTDDKSIPHNITSLRLGYRMMPFQCNVMMRYVSEYDSKQFTTDNLYHQIGDFSRIDANISYDFTVAGNQWRATIFGQNLTDEEYETRLGWEDVGMTYGLELSVTF